MTNEEIDYSAYMNIGHNSAGDMGELAKLAEAQHEAEIEVEKCQTALDAATVKLRGYSEKLVPEKMDMLGLTTYKTTSGISVKVKESIRVSVSPEKRSRAWSWLEQNGFGALIKSVVVCPYGTGEIEEANQLVEKLRNENRIANLERKVEPMTLMSFVSEELAKGKDIPLDIFGVFRQRVAKINVEVNKKDE